MLTMFMHHIDCLSCALTISNTVYPWFFFFFFLSLFYLSFPILSIMVRKTRAHRASTSSSTPSFDSERSICEKN